VEARGDMGSSEKLYGWEVVEVEVGFACRKQVGAVGVEAADKQVAGVADM
jgi:hypothetical protein